jgi:peptidoglycan/LPS O-acetylase OafA/YrhL
MYFITNLAALVLAVVQYGLSVIDLQKTAFTFLLQIGGGLENGNPYNSPTWFVSTLLLCYLAFFFIAYRARSTTQYYCFIAFGVALGYGLIKANLQIPFCYQETGVGLMNFSIGLVLAEICPRIRESVHKSLRIPGFVMLLLALFLIFRYGVEIICGDVLVAFAFVICPLIIYLAIAGGICTRILQWKGLVFLGKMSVSIFFWHLVFYNGFVVVCSLMGPEEAMNERLYLLYFGLMFLWSYASYRFLEPYISRKLDALLRKHCADPIPAQ